MQAKKIALLGFDCAITHLVRQHIEEGICPNFKKVMDQGTVAENCHCPFPTITPPNWTAMATGAWPGTNGVTDFFRHIPGTSPTTENTHNSFNWDYVLAESFFEAAERAGKRSIVFNFPASYNVHKKLKNSIVVGGAALTVGVYMDQVWVAETRGKSKDNDSFNAFCFSDDILLSTESYPGTSVRVKFEDAKGWTNVDDMGDNPLEYTASIPFAGSILDTKNATWYVLVRDLGDGYDTVTLSPSKNFKDAFFTIKAGEWSQAFNATGLLADGGTKEIRLKAKLISMDDEAENFKLFISHGLNTDGDFWCFPKDVAKKLNKGNNITTNNTGMFSLSSGWIDLDMWLELIENHYDWLADSIEAILTTEEWDVFYSHAHPTDYIYHVLMTELDPNTCSSKVSHDKAWEYHRRLYKAADKYLGRLLKLMDDETLVTLISDHGATPDGPTIDLNKVLSDANLATLDDSGQVPGWVETLPDNMRDLARDSYKKRLLPEKSRAMPQRSCFIYVNLKGRDPGGIVEPEDYYKTQREICAALMSYVDPKTGTHPFCLALPKEEAALLGQWGDQCGDVVYACWPEFGSQHGNILPYTSYGIGDMRPLCVFYGPKIGVKQGYSMERNCNLVDLVPTYSYMTGWPIPKDAEGSIIYQLMENPDKNC